MGEKNGWKCCNKYQMGKEKKHELISLPKIVDARGNLTFVENLSQIPFEIARVFWIHDVPGGEFRGGHAYLSQHEFIIALSGSFDIIINDGFGGVEKITLNRSYMGLYLPPMTWRHMENFSTNALSLHFSSSIYNKSDYLRDFIEFSEKKVNG